MRKEEQVTTVYTIVYTAADLDRGNFPFAEARGSYLSPAFAREELERQIVEEKAELDDRYDCEERNGDYWEMYQDGYAADAYSRLQIFATTLHPERSG